MYSLLRGSLYRIMQLAQVIMRDNICFLAAIFTFLLCLRLKFKTKKKGKNHIRHIISQMMTQDSWIYIYIYLFNSSFMKMSDFLRLAK